MAHPPALFALISGTIAYRDGAGEEIGRERFELASHPGGHILRAFCEMDDISLLRDVTIAMDEAWRPIEGYCRVTSGGRLLAATWIAADAEGVMAESQIRDHGHVRQRLALTEPLTYLGLHPLQGDALIVQVRGEDAPGKFRQIQAVTNSISPNGDENLQAMLTTIDVAFIGREQITVAAGTFAARRYALRWREDWPPADMWVREDDCAFLLMRWSKTENWFELTAINDRTSAKDQK